VTIPAVQVLETRLRKPTRPPYLEYVDHSRTLGSSRLRCRLRSCRVEPQTKGHPGRFYSWPGKTKMSTTIVTLTTEQQVPLSVAFFTATGNPANVVGTPTWSVDDTSIVDLIPAADGSVLVDTKAVGSCLVTATGNAGSKNVSENIGITVTAPEAETAVITPGAIQPKPVVIILNNVVVQPDGSALVSGQGAPNKVYRILASDDVTGPYAEIGQATSDSTGAFSFVDTDAPNHATRFYRAVWP